jgi:hypothetical protein
MYVTDLLQNFVTTTLSDLGYKRDDRSIMVRYPTETIYIFIHIYKLKPSTRPSFLRLFQLHVSTHWG